MSTRTIHAVAIVTMLVAGLAVAAFAADSVKIVRAVPQSGTFPVSPASGVVRVAYTLDSALFGAVTAGPMGPVPSFAYGWKIQSEPVWVERGSGEVTVQYTVLCGAETPPSPVSLTAAMQTAKTKYGLLGAYTASTQLKTQGTLPCNPPPDITVPAHGGIIIGTRPAPWGGTATLAGAEATAAKHGTCLFDARYDVVDAGGSAAAWPFTNRLAVDTPGNPIAETANLVLRKGESRTIPVKLPLPSGTHTLFLVLDAGGANAQANENAVNNQVQTTYTLTASCGGGLH